jgi:dynein heavy chain, axonemal
LEKVEFGGVKGKALSTKVFKIFEEFKEEFEKFSNKKYEPLDPDGKVSQIKKCFFEKIKQLKAVFLFLKEFDLDYSEFEKFVFDLDCRLSAIIIQAFDDCSGLTSIFKVCTFLK